MSIVEANRSELEKLGEYVIRANASTGWFAVFPRKVEACRSQARALARTDFHLVVYRTVDADERDHWALPFSLVAQEFTAASLTHSAVNGVDRWNCTFRNGFLHVTHTGRDLDCSPFYRQPLIIEVRRSDAALPEEVAEDEAFAEGNKAVHRTGAGRFAQRRTQALGGRLPSLTTLRWARHEGRDPRQLRLGQDHARA
ncbi:MAG: hypothetical protein ACYC23_14390, partial [Limisphaerales bacterium]